ncbi:MAG: outer rane biosis protein BamB [Planctomycetaceae bacterium]|nr:outer rane biosis protein BamB [Planctomycetaceae bacterium]
MNFWKSPWRMLVAGVMCGILSPVLAADWPQFRGPGGQGVSAETGLPAKWDATHGQVWKTDLPGAGASSAIIIGDRVFLTCFTEPGSDKMTRHLMCLSRTDGKILWKKSVPCKSTEDSWSGFLRDHGYTSATPASDGEHVYVFYGKAGVVGYDLEGKELWRADVGDGSAKNGWGSGSSPMIYKNTVIVNAGAESDAIIALDKLTGKEVWRAKAESAAGSWGTPILVDAGNGKQDLVIGVPYEIWGLNPDTGKLRWYAEVLDSVDTMCTSLIAHDGVVYAIGGRQSGAAAVKAGGSGDVSKSHLLWKASIGSYVTSPVYHDGHLYWVSDRGIAVCLNAKTGEKVYENRVDGARNLYASVTAADGKLYAVTRRSGTFVLDAKPVYAVISQNDLGDDSDFNASPSVSHGQLFLRSNKALYCLGEKK